MNTDAHGLADNALPPDHFLSLPRPDVAVGPPAGIVDTTTLAAHDFDVDQRTGFMPPQPPPARLPSQWEVWETTLEDAVNRKLRIGDSINLSESDAASSEAWRARVRKLSILPTKDLTRSEVILRRAHAVLARILHFYVHSLPPDAPILIPPPLTTPLLQVSAQLQLPPVLTYSDCVLYNWALKTSTIDAAPALDNLSALLLFTGTTDEEEFYLVPARIELRGVEALELMQATMDEMFVGDAIAVRRVTAYLFRISTILHEIKSILLSQRDGSDPEIFYREIRPWLRGADSDPNARKWVFEGIEDDPRLREPTELSGPSAGQSALIHALDIFLGVDWSSSTVNPSSTAGPGSTEQSFFMRMRSYMPRHHRAFLAHLSANPRPLRGLVLSSADLKLTEAYNMAVTALSEFRQAHMTIVALYIMGPARRLRKEKELDGQGLEEHTPLRGTGGTELAKFLKGVTEQTKEAMVG